MPDRISSYAMKHTLVVFVSIFLLTFLLQLSIWLTSPNYLDESLWFNDAVKISHGILPGFDTPSPVHPGTALLLPAAIFLQLPIDARFAYHSALSLLMALAITFSAYACFLLRPKTLWWLCVVALLAPNTIFPESTAPSALASVLTVLVILLLLFARERPSTYALSFLGVGGGILAATRMDSGATLAIFALPYLWSFVGKKIFIPLIFSLLFFLALDPYIFVSMTDHFYNFFAQMNQNRQVNNVFAHTFWIVFLPSVSILAAFIYVYLRPKLTSLPRDFLLWLLAISEILCIALMISDYHPMRYFLPMICVWEVFLAIFALEYVQQEPFFKTLKIKAEYLLAGFFISSRIFRAILLYAGYYLAFNLQDFLIETAAKIIS